MTPLLILLSVLLQASVTQFDLSESIFNFYIAKGAFVPIFRTHLAQKCRIHQKISHTKYIKKNLMAITYSSIPELQLLKFETEMVTT